MSITPMSSSRSIQYDDTLVETKSATFQSIYPPSDLIILFMAYVGTN